jgi:hypothetical protein
MFHDIASSATTALVIEEFIGRFAVSGTAGSVCMVCQALREPEWTLVMREGDHEPPRLCRPHINRLRALSAAGERVAAAERSLSERSATLVKAVMQPEDPDDPFFRRVAAVLRLHQDRVDVSFRACREIQPIAPHRSGDPGARLR